MSETATPLYVDVLLVAMYVLLAAAAALTLWSLWRSMRRQGPDNSHSNGIPARRIGWLTVALLVVTLVLTYVLASTRPLVINGRPFADRFWLRVSDMLIVTSGVLIAVAVIGVVAGMVRREKGEVRNNA